MTIKSGERAQGLKPFGVAQECGITIREITNSSGPSIGKDTWREINLSLTRDLKWSKGEFVRIHET